MIDLLDLSPLAPFTQQGLTNALLLIGSLSIWSLMMLETGFGQLLVVIGGLTLTGTALALYALLPIITWAIGWIAEEILGRVFL